MVAKYADSLLWRPVMKYVATATLAIALGLAAFAAKAGPKERFLADLQQAVRDKDTAWFSSHIDYPMTVRGKNKLVIRSPSQVAKNGPDAFIGPKLRSDVLAQKPEDLFSNWQGMMIGSGDHNVWAHETTPDSDRPDYRIFSINGGS